jgi:site-specific DNA-methyltransferase (adenine-specific)
MSEGKKEILLGDCLELMKDIPSGSIDMTICDLPYGTTACKWDTIIPFDKLWEQYERIIKPNGAIVLTASQPFTSALIMSNPKLFRYEWIWEKTLFSNFALVKKQPAKLHENVLIFYKKQPTYNPKMQVGKPYFDKPRKRTMGVINDAIGMKKAIQNKGERYPSSVQKFSNGNNGTIHPTQKPIELFEYLIKTYTNEGELVLDNCAGSGTTAIACLKTNRQFIVMEKEQKYYDIILKRVGDFNKNFEPQTLFGNEM